MPHIVVVEDDLANACLLATVLQRLGGFQVTATEDVREVLRLAKEGQVDLVVLDVSLANSSYEGQSVSGLEVGRLLKDDSETCDIPVILLTAHAMQGDRERFLAESKADDYLTKPVTDQMALIERLKSMIDGSRERQKAGDAIAAD